MWQFCNLIFILQHNLIFHEARFCDNSQMNTIVAVNKEKYRFSIESDVIKKCKRKLELQVKKLCLHRTLVGVDEKIVMFLDFKSTYL